MEGNTYFYFWQSYLGKCRKLDEMPISQNDKKRLINLILSSKLELLGGFANELF